jgi:hypothetical protein
LSRGRSGTLTDFGHDAADYSTDVLRDRAERYS